MGKEYVLTSNQERDIGMASEDTTVTKAELALAKSELGIVPLASEVFGRRFSKFMELVNDLRAVNEMKRESEAESKRLNGLLQEMWADCESKTVLREDGGKVTLVSSSNSSIKKELLVELGVPAETVKAATVVTPYQYVLITEPKASR